MGWSALPYPIHFTCFGGGFNHSPTMAWSCITFQSQLNIRQFRWILDDGVDCDCNVDLASDNLARVFLFGCGPGYSACHSSRHGIFDVVLHDRILGPDQWPISIIERARSVDFWKGWRRKISPWPCNPCDTTLSNSLLAVSKTRIINYSTGPLNSIFYRSIVRIAYV